MAAIYRDWRVRIAANTAKDVTESFYFSKPIVTSTRLSHLRRPQAEKDPGSKISYSYRACVVNMRMICPGEVDVAHLGTRGYCKSTYHLPIRSTSAGTAAVWKFIINLGERWVSMVCCLERIDDTKQLPLVPANFDTSSERRHQESEHGFLET